MGHNAALLKRVKPLNVPMVSLNPTRRMPCVINDDATIGRLAAEHLISRGFRNIGFVLRSDSIEGSEGDRFRSFRKTVEAAGRTFHQLRMKRLAEELPQLPKPIALMAGDDGPAVQVQYICEDLGFAIPQEVAVMGANDDPLQCELAPVPLTSVHHNQDVRGYTAAKVLDSILDGESPPTEPVLITPKGVTVRQSTDIVEIPHVRTATALTFIRDNYSDQITPDSVATTAFLSRRRLDQLFLKHVGWSIDEEIRRCRLDDAKRLLRETDWKYDAISLECGFSGATHFSRTFTRKEGMSPREYRNGTHRGR